MLTAIRIAVWGVMKRLHAIIVGAVLLVFSAAFALPAVDSPETAYDESETQPFECAPPVSSVVAHAARLTNEFQRAPLPVRATAASLLDVPRLIIADTDAPAAAPNLVTQVFPIRC